LARARTEQKREEIVRIASQVFEELGFEGTSMATISERVGGSKATLYGYFPSKDDLLRAVIKHKVTSHAAQMIREFPADPGYLLSSLIKLSTAYLTERTSPLPINNIRIVTTQPPGSTMGLEFYHDTIVPAFAKLTACFKQLMDEGRLKKADPKLVTMHWKGLSDWDFFERRLLGVFAEPDPKEVKAAATAAANAFLQLYGSDDHQEVKPKRQKRPRRDKHDRKAV